MCCTATAAEAVAHARAKTYRHTGAFQHVQNLLHRVLWVSASHQGQGCSHKGRCLRGARQRNASSCDFGPWCQQAKHGSTAQQHNINRHCSKGKGCWRSAWVGGLHWAGAWHTNTQPSVNQNPRHTLPARASQPFNSFNTNTPVGEAHDSILHHWRV